MAAWRIGRALGRRTFVFWPKQPGGSPYPAEEFFDFTAIARSGKADDLVFVNDNLRHYLQKIGPHANLDKAPGWPRALDRNELQSSPLPLVTDVLAKAGFAEETSASITAEILLLFSLLIPHAAVRSGYQQLRSWIGSSPYVCVHVRRGDVIRSIEGKLREFLAVAPEDEQARDELFSTNLFKPFLEEWIYYFVRRVTTPEAYLEALQLASVDAPTIALLTDSPEALAPLRHRFPHARVAVVSDFQTAHALSPLQRAYVEYLLTTQANAVYSTASNFCSLARHHAATPFTDVRRFAGAEGTRRAFEEIFENCFAQSPFLRQRCREILEATLAQKGVLPVPETGPKRSARAH